MAKGARRKGTVKWFCDTGGFGYISPDGGGKDVFVDQSSVVNTDGVRSLAPGEAVEFDVAYGPYGDDGHPKAVDVTGPGRSPLQGPSGGGDRSYGGRECYNCGQPGHPSRDCPAT